MTPDDRSSIGMPPIGFGTYPMRGAECQRAVEAALAAGWRMIDTASLYRNEADVGAAIAASGVRRDDIFIVTKVWPSDLAPADFRRSTENSLKALRIDAVDLLLIHWPEPKMTVGQMLAPLNEARRRGAAHHIGISNFNRRLVEEALAATSEPLSALQCEFHPYLDQSRLRQTCRDNGLAFMAYTPLGRRQVLDEPDVQDIATRLGRTSAQVILRWHLQLGSVPIPKAANPGHIRQNLDVFGFELSDAQMNVISGLAHAGGRIVEASGMGVSWKD
jgi:diketogulonate reductase-like aldo/keto reductase